jgi:hypothetical protein
MRRIIAAALGLGLAMVAIPGPAQAVEIFCKDGYRHIASKYLKDSNGFTTMYVTDVFKNRAGTRIGIDTRGGTYHDTFQKLYRGSTTLKSSRGHADTGCITYPLTKIKPNSDGVRVIGVYASVGSNGQRTASVRFKIRARL